MRTTATDIDQRCMNYRRIEKAMQFISTNLKQQPALDQMAASVGLSPFHFQRVFKKWAGVTPKQFMQFLRLQHAKTLLSASSPTLLNTAFDVGLSGPSRLHDLFVNIECMTPGQFKLGGDGLNIRYAFFSSPFGKVCIASTSKGVCHIAFEEDESSAFAILEAQFPRANFLAEQDEHQCSAFQVLQFDNTKPSEVTLHIAGSPFQLKVWEALLRIPVGQLATYSNLASKIGSPKAHRAVGTAIGRNPIAYLIPCHRVIQSSGYLGGYRWGTARKAAIIGWEAAHANEHRCDLQNDLDAE